MEGKRGLGEDGYENTDYMEEENIKGGIWTCCGIRNMGNKK
jgi:hypothetical protein